MKIKLTSVFVQDQNHALKFYTETLGFIEKRNMPLGEYKWLTVVSPDETNGAELLLEPNANPASKTFQEALYAQGVSAASFFVDDIGKQYARLKDLGVNFKTDPTQMGHYSFAILDDTCGNWIVINQVGKKEH